jgi:prolyl oligopeptidase
VAEDDEEYAMQLASCCRSLSAPLILVSGICANGFGFAQTQPVAPVRPVTTDYFGTKVVDNYRYMEDLENSEVKAWMKAQADYTRGTLDAIPARQPLLDRIHALRSADVRRSDFVRRGDRYFYKVLEPRAQLAKLYYRDGLNGKEQLLLDPAEMSKGTATHYALDYFQPSWDGKLIAYGVSAGGSEKSVLHVMDVNTGAVQGESIDRTSDSVVSWRPDTFESGAT